MYKGTIVENSLADKSILDKVKITKTWQDDDWTLHDVSVEENQLEELGKAIIIEIIEKKIKDLTLEELNKHEYKDLDSMLTSHKGYYGDKVNLDTDVKIIIFKLT